MVVSVVGASVLVVLGLGPGVPDAIVGGEPVVGGAYRSAVLIDRGIDLCTGTLLTPHVVVTAAHCLGGAPPEQLQVRVGNRRDEPEQVLGVMHRAAHPQFCSGLLECGEDLHDFAYLQLAEPAPADAVVPRLPLDQAIWDAAVRAGAPVALVGFGRDDDGQQGVKRVVEVPIRGTTATGLEFLAGQDGKDGCQGDSGGPAYARLADGSEVLVGVGSRGLACGEGGYFGIAPTALCWIDEELGLGWSGACDIDPDPGREESAGCRLGAGRSSGAGPWVLLVVVLGRRRRGGARATLTVIHGPPASPPSELSSPTSARVGSVSALKGQWNVRPILGEEDFDCGSAFPTPPDAAPVSTGGFEMSELDDPRRSAKVLEYEPRSMHRSLVIALVLVVGCDRDDRDPGDTEPPPGHLEYDSEVTDIYRDGKRIEVVPVSEPSSDRRCGYLTERALRDLQSTIDALDPSVDYDFELGDEECGWSESPAAQIHLEGFEHSPFSCDEFCCRPELAMVPSVYFLVLNNLDGMAPIVDGEPYVAVEPDEPCP